MLCHVTLHGDVICYTIETYPMAEGNKPWTSQLHGPRAVEVYTLSKIALIDTTNQACIGFISCSANTDQRTQAIYRIVLFLKEDCQTQQCINENVGSTITMMENRIGT